MTQVVVDRSSTIEYPHWVRRLVYPELQGTGPTRYSLRDVELWLHPGQMAVGIPVRDIQAYLERTRLLVRCLRIHDGRAIESLGVDVFRRFFEFNALYLWASMVVHSNGELYVPFCDVRGGAAGQYATFGWQWAWAGFDCYARNPAACFKANLPF